METCNLRQHTLDQSITLLPPSPAVNLFTASVTHGKVHLHLHFSFRSGMEMSTDKVQGRDSNGSSEHCSLLSCTATLAIDDRYAQ